MTFLPNYRRFGQVVTVALMVLLTVSITAVMVLVRQSGDRMMFAALLLLQLGMILLLRPRFLTTLAAVTAMTAVYVAGDLLHGVYGPDVRIRMWLYLGIGAFIAAVASYRLEKTRRERYFYTLLYERQRRRVHEAEKLEGVRAIARTIAHEFNTPLSTILGAWDYAIRPRLEREGERERELLLKIPNNVRRMEALVRQLLELTRLRGRDYVAGISMYGLEEEDEGSGGPQRTERQGGEPDTERPHLEREQNHGG
jgi:signal transduction histidine kinase